MKKITVAVETEVYERTRIKAAELNTSVSALVQAFLIKLVEEGNDVERRRHLQQETPVSIHAFSASDRLGREQVHERNMLP